MRTITRSVISGQIKLLNYSIHFQDLTGKYKNLNFSKLAIIRPSLLIGNRKSFRLGEVIFTPVMNTVTLFAFGGLKKYKPIKIQNVVKAILYISKNVSDKIVFESDELERIAKSN